MRGYPASLKFAASAEGSTDWQLIASSSSLGLNVRLACSGQLTYQASRHLNPRSATSTYKLGISAAVAPFAELKIEAREPQVCPEAWPSCGPAAPGREELAELLAAAEVQVAAAAD